MSRFTSNQEGNNFLLGQVAQSVADYFILLERYQEAAEEYREAVSFYESIFPHASNFLKAQKNKAIANRKLDKISRGERRDITLSRTVNLSQWLNNNFSQAVETGWQAVGYVLSTQQAELAFSLRKESQQFRERVKQIDLEPEDSAVALIITVAKTNDEKVRIIVQVHPMEGKVYLPNGLTLGLLSESGEVLQEVRVRSQDNYIKLKTFRLAKRGMFSLKLALGDVSITEEFRV